MWTSNGNKPQRHSHCIKYRSKDAENVQGNPEHRCPPYVPWVPTHIFHIPSRDSPLNYMNFALMTFAVLKLGLKAVWHGDWRCL